MKNILQTVFSVKNAGNHKVVTLLGIKIKIKIKKSSNISYTICVKDLLNVRDMVTNKDKMKIVTVSDRCKRLNFVTDTIEKQSLLGGVGTALILASEYCKKFDYELRIITRSTPVNLDDYLNFMKMMDLTTPDNVSVYTDYQRKQGNTIIEPLCINKDDLFFATSWWSAKAIKKTGIDKFFYIIQEVEPFFYNYGDDHLECETLLKDENITYIVNHKFLWDYLKIHYQNITNNGIYFNPCFNKLYHNSIENVSKYKEKRKLFFYSREANSRNLYYTGLKVLDKAVTQNIIDTKSWDIYFAGAELTPIHLSNGYKPIFKGQMTWKDYANFLKEIDLSFSLMYTPHTSYPPLDVVSSGGVAVTNKFANKTASSWSDNIIFSDLEEKALLSAIQQGITLAGNIPLRIENYKKQTIPNDWCEEFKNVVEYMGENIK